LSIFKPTFIHATLLMLFLTFATDGSAQTSNLETKEKALNIIEDFAERLCSIPLEGKADKLNLSGNAKVEVSKLIKQLANLGINGAAKYQTSKWEGVLQKDLAGLLARKIDCKKEVWKDLKDKFGFASVKPSNNQKNKSSQQPAALQSSTAVTVGDILNNTNTQVNINSPNSTQITNNIRVIEGTFRVENERKEDIFITRIILTQTKGIWNQGTLFKFGAKLSAPYIDYEFVKGMPSARMNWMTGDNPANGIIYIETTTAPLDEDIVVEIKSRTSARVEAIQAEPIVKK